MDWPFKHFQPKEVLSVDGLAQYHAGNLMISPQLLEKLDGFREFLGYPILINYAGMTNRGYRSPEENYAVGGARLSRHVQGLAVDMTVQGISPEEVAEAAIGFGFGYAKVYPTWTHIDLRYRLES